MKLIINALGLLLGTNVVYDKSVVIENRVILDILDSAEVEKKYPSGQILNLNNLILAPGTVNAHNHSFQSLLRGIATDRPFLEWRDKTLYAYSQKMRLEDIYNGALFAFAEMMKCGVTTVCDFFYLHQYGIRSDEAVIKAAHDLGIRLCLARTMYDWDGAPLGYRETVDRAYTNTETLMKEYNNGMVKVIPAPHSLHAASPDMVLAGHELALKYNTPMHIHVAEEKFEVNQVKERYNATPLEYLDKIGVVDNHLSIIHGVWMTKEEIQCLGEKGGNLIYCPSSNMFLADGVTDIPYYIDAGVNIALGSDGACGNNRISVIEEMRMASILQKAVTCNASCVNFYDAFHMGTTNASNVLGLKIGAIEVGKYADFIGVDVSDFSMQPISAEGNQFLPNFVYSLQPTAIKFVMVNGEITVNNGCLSKITEKKILNLVSSTMKYLEEG